MRNPKSGCDICIMFDNKLWLVRSTPLGNPVVPLEYGINITSSGRLGGGSFISNVWLANSEKFIEPAGKSSSF